MIRFRLSKCHQLLHKHKFIIKNFTPKKRVKPLINTSVKYIFPKPNWPTVSLSLYIMMLLTFRTPDVLCLLSYVLCPMYVLCLMSACIIVLLDASCLVSRIQRIPAFCNPDVNSHVKKRGFRQYK